MSLETLKKLMQFENDTDETKQKMTRLYGEEKTPSTTTQRTTASINPFLNKNGEVFNPYINYRVLLDSKNISDATKRFITEATGLQQTVTATPTASVQSAGQTPESLYMLSGTGGTQPSTEQTPASTGSTPASTGYTPAPTDGTQTPSSYASYVGQRITDTSKFNNSAAKGQCVWYVRGRAAEKMGVDPGSLGHAKDVWYNAPSDKKVSATTDNLKPNMIVSYASGPGTAAQYGHVIYIEDVVGDTVYYTEGGSTYYNKGTDGVVKTASRQGILDGKNANGGTIGANVVGFIDLNRY